MGWTAPNSYSTGQIMVAADLNLIRDNLNYLKGNAGTVTIGDVIAPTGVAALRNDGSYQFTCERTSAVARKFGFAVSGSDGSFGLDDVTAGARRMTIDTSGNVGFGGVTTPAGPVQARGAGGSMLFLSAAAVAGTLVTLAAAGTVTSSAIFWAYDRNNTTGTGIMSFAAGSLMSLGSGGVTYTNTDTMKVDLTVGGAITVQRTAGTNGTHQINILVLYF